MKTSIKILSLTSVILMTACTGPDKAASLDPNAWPEALNMAYSPSSENPEARETFYNEIATYLSDYVGVPVELFQTSSYGPVIEAMRAKKIDIAQGGSFSYMIAAEKAGAEPLVTMGFKNEDGSFMHGIYYSVIAVPKDSEIDSIEELKANAKDITFSFTDAASTSGHLIPRDGIEQNGINPDEMFKRVVFTQSHLNSIMTIVAGKVEAGALQESAFTRLAEKGKVNLDDIKIIWRSEPINRGPVLTRRDLPRSLKEKIRSAFLDMKEIAPELYYKRFTVFGAHYPEGMTYVPAYDHMWDNLRDIALRMDNMRLIRGTKGLSDWNEAKRLAFLEEAKIREAEFELASAETSN
jgi:phosphonate transport system substrate-binding protein